MFYLRLGPQFKENVAEVVKVKAHLAESPDFDDQLNARIRGNALADSLAKQGARLHPDIRGDIYKYKSLCKDIITLAHHMIDCLSGLAQSRPPGKLKKLPKGFKAPEPFHGGFDGKAAGGKGPFPPGRSHIYRWHGNCWICDVCLKRSYKTEIN